jgi:hypothetical protein
MTRIDAVLGRMLGDLLAGAGGLALDCALDRVTAAFDPATGTTTETRTRLAAGRLIWGRDPVAAGQLPDLSAASGPRRPALVEGLGVAPTPGDLIVIGLADWRVGEAIRPVAVLDLWRLQLSAPAGGEGG